jgi:hypothetical protein
VQHLQATVNAAAKMQVVLSKDGTPTEQVTDEDGDGGDRSVRATVNDGIGGGYVMAFKKAADGEEDYAGEADCRDANNAIHQPTIDLI